MCVRACTLLLGSVGPPVGTATEEHTQLTARGFWGVGMCLRGVSEGLGRWHGDHAGSLGSGSTGLTPHAHFREALQGGHSASTPTGSTQEAQQTLSLVLQQGTAGSHARPNGCWGLPDLGFSPEDQECSLRSLLLRFQ